MQLSSVLALYSGAINQLFVISIPSIKLMNPLNRNMISLFHSFIVWFRHLFLFNVHPHTARILRNHLHARQITGMEWPACSPDLKPIEQLWNQLGKAIRSIQSAGPTTDLPWTMGYNPTDQDHQTGPQHEEKVPSYMYHRGIWRINTVLINMWAIG